MNGRKTGPQVLTSILSALSRLNLFRVTNSGQLGFTWITEILNSRYPEEDRYRLAGMVVRLLGEEVSSHPPKYFGYG